jgi:hypothetical protein
VVNTRTAGYRRAGPGEDHARDGTSPSSLSKSCVAELIIVQDQLDILARKFAKSPRITLLLGLRQEAQGDTAGAKATYEALLKTDETNVGLSRNSCPTATHLTFCVVALTRTVCVSTPHCPLTDHRTKHDNHPPARLPRHVLHRSGGLVPPRRAVRGSGSLRPEPRCAGTRHADQHLGLDRGV